MSVSPEKIKDHIIIDEILGHDHSLANDLKVVNGRLWIYDDLRNKWLSTDRLQASAARKGRSKNVYLRIQDSQAINLTGYRVPHNATITAIVAVTRDIETWVLRVRKNGNPTNIASLSLSGVSGKHDTTIDVDLNEGDQVQFYAETSTFLGIRDPFVWVEIAWREENL